MAQIWYSHHPFFGQTVEIVRWLRRQTSESLLVKLPDGVQIAIAAWMLDPLACSQRYSAMRREKEIAYYGIAGETEVWDFYGPFSSAG